MKFSLPICSTAVSTLIFISATSEGAVVSTIDTFDAATSDVDLSGNNGFKTESSSGLGIVGGTRNNSLTVTSNPLLQTARSRLNYSDSGVLSISLGTQVAGFVELDYDNGGTGIGGFDLTVAGMADSLGWKILFLDLPTRLGAVVTDTSGASANSSFDLVSSISSATEVTMPFTGFTLTEGSSFDWTNVDTIKFQVEPTTAAMDVVIDDFYAASTIPEPGVGILCTLAAGALAFVRRRPE
ncbi:MAG: hypothetical protein R3F19_06615 [Verrucomicrobiales bacterium]